MGEFRTLDGFCRLPNYILYCGMSLVVMVPCSTGILLVLSGYFASMALASIGIMDWVKPAVLPVAVQSKVSRLASPLVENHEERQEPVMDDEQSNEEKIAKEGSDAPERTTEGEVKEF